MKAAEREDRRDHDERARSIGHPIDMNTLLEPEYLEAAAEVSSELQLAEPIPKLCTLVTASPFDAAMHDAFGKAARPQLLPDLRRRTSWPRPVATTSAPSSRASPSTATSSGEPKPRCRSITWSARSTRSSLPTSGSAISDGLPETLPEWIDYNGLTHLKIKLNGDDLDWDVDRVLHVDGAAAEAQAKRGVTRLGATRSTSTRSARTSTTCSSSSARSRRRRPRGFRPHPVHRAADRPRPEGRPRERHARGVRDRAGGHRRIADRSRTA